MISFLKLIRYKNLLMVLLTIILTKYALISSFLKESNLNGFDFLILSLSVLLITAGGYIINDIYDIEADKINKPHKVYISNTISKKRAIIFYLLFTILGLILGLWLSFFKNIEILSLYFITTAVLLLLYSKYLKRLPLLGNLLISLLVPFIIMLVYEFDKKLVTKSEIFNDLFLSIIVFYYIFFAFLTTLIRELIKDIEDVDGDFKLKMKTLPILIGKIRTRNISIVLSFVLMFFLMLLLNDSFGSEDLYLSAVTSLISILLVYFIFKLWSAKTKAQFHFLSNLMKVMMLIGILSMVLFKFN
tara:strand:- start:26890 stop:27795 length:906 start_codon:yes stop_codon:yes gene_type:complete